MHDFSPPSLAVTLLLTLLRWDVLVHLDCVEDWMRPSPRSSHSRQSGLPSSDDDDDRPFPRRLATGNWLHGMEDGRSGGGVADPRTKELACVASSGCRGVPSSRARWEHSGNDRDGHKRSWKGVLLGRSHDKEAATAGSSSERHKSQAPTSWLRQGGSHGTRERIGMPTSFWCGRWITALSRWPGHRRGRPSWRPSISTCRRAPSKMACHATRRRTPWLSFSLE
ncbi:hypothetical protein ZWY2020_040365 [Hordeum vulgare]|nr:hypothetical protein ZWY2020_040365 [Hordeum vulgare]